MVFMIDKQTREEDSQWQTVDCRLGWDLAREGGKKPPTFIGGFFFLFCLENLTASFKLNQLCQRKKKKKRKFKEEAEPLAQKFPSNSLSL